ncbi:hypothetical protein GQ600_14774 [Phytophthora cactorum]|nr:hypothetical protein GQ600_14774 [Phytophthora cactorum]
MFDAFKSDSSNGSTAFAEVAEATTNAEVPPTTIPTAIPLNIPSPLSSKTRSKEFLEFEGATIFAPSPSPTYRYSLSLKSGMLRIWLENSESKKQWCTKELGIQDYVDSSNVIPDATTSRCVLRTIVNTITLNANCSMGLSINSAFEIFWTLLMTTWPTFQPI